MKSWTLNCFHFIMAYIRGLEVCKKNPQKTQKNPDNYLQHTVFITVKEITFSLLLLLNVCKISINIDG
jgi:hypothetical protein